MIIVQVPDKCQRGKYKRLSIRHLQWIQSIIYHKTGVSSSKYYPSINQSEQAEEQKQQTPAPHDTSAVDVCSSQAFPLLVPFFPPSIPIPPSPGRGGALRLPYLHVVSSLPLQPREVDAV